MFSAATRLVTHSEPATATLLANGVPAAKVQQVEVGCRTRRGVANHGSGAGPTRRLPRPDVLRDLGGERTEIEAAVRARADELRSARDDAQT